VKSDPLRHGFIQNFDLLLTNVRKNSKWISIDGPSLHKILGELNQCQNILACDSFLGPALFHFRINPHSNHDANIKICRYVPQNDLQFFSCLFIIQIVLFHLSIHIRNQKHYWFYLVLKFMFLFALAFSCLNWYFAVIWNGFGKQR
jgi:hypothetical protein